MEWVRLMVLLCALLVACTPERPSVRAAAVPAPRASSSAAPAPTAHTRDEVLRDVLARNVALLAERNVARYIAGWRADGRFTMARYPQPDAYDATLDVEQLAVFRTIFAEEEPPREVSYENERVELGEGTAKLTWTLISSVGGDIDLFAETYELSFERGSWRITRLRSWPVARVEHGQRFTFGAGWTDELDREVAHLVESGGDESELVYALVCAYRYREALTIVRRLTETLPDSVWHWNIRALCAGFVGDTNDALSSYQRYRALAEQKVP